MGNTKGAVTIHLVPREPREGEGDLVRHARNQMLYMNSNFAAGASIQREGDEAVRFSADLFALADDITGETAVADGMNYLRETYPMVSAFGVELAVTLVHADGTSVAVI